MKGTRRPVIKRFGHKSTIPGRIVRTGRVTNPLQRPGIKTRKDRPKRLLRAI